MKVKGKKVFVIGSGPSLTKEDCAAVQNLDAITIAVNNAWQYAPFCQYLYAGDTCWWANNEANLTISPIRITCSQNASVTFKAKFHRAKGAYNSGLRAIEWAVENKAAEVYLLGFDHSVKHGTHFHGDHEHTQNPDTKRCKRWVKQSERLKDSKTLIFNCSRYTELTVFKQITLEQAIARLSESEIHNRQESPAF